MSIIDIDTYFDGVIRPTVPKIQVLQAYGTSSTTAGTAVGLFGAGNIVTSISLSSESSTIISGLTYSIVATNSGTAAAGQVIYQSLCSTYASAGPGLGAPLACDSWLLVKPNATTANVVDPLTLVVTYLSP